MLFFMTTRRNAVMGTMLVSMCLAVCTTALGQSTITQKEKDTAIENELNRRTVDEQLERVLRLKVGFELKVRRTDELLDRLAKHASEFEKERLGLLTNDKGKALAADPVSFMAFLRLYEEPATTSEKVSDKKIAVQLILTSLPKERQQSDVGYLPPPELFDELSSLNAWANDRFARLQAQQATLKTLLADAPAVRDIKTAKQMGSAIQEYRAKWHKLLAESRILGEQQAESESGKVLVEAARLAKLEEIQAERERFLEETRTEIARLKLVQEAALLQLQMDAERERFEAEKRHNDAMVELERLRRDSEAAREVAEKRADIIRQQQRDVAAREEQIAKVNSPEVKELLSSFFASGSWQPGKRRLSYEPGPISYKQLMVVGALKPDSVGLNHLLDVVNARLNDRPRWGKARKLASLSADGRARLVKAQKLLIELGPLMVEEGLLAP